MSKACRVCGCQRLVGRVGVEACRMYGVKGLYSVVLKACRVCVYQRLVGVCLSKACRVFVCQRLVGCLCVKGL